ARAWPPWRRPLPRTRRRSPRRPPAGSARRHRPACRSPPRARPRLSPASAPPRAGRRSSGTRSATRPPPRRRPDTSRCPAGRGDDHGLDRAAAEPPETLLERQPEQPELGVFGPQLPAKTFRRLHVGLARLELVMVRQQSLDAVLEQPLLLVQLEVHLSESRGS